MRPDEIQIGKMDFEKLADIFEQRAISICKWASCEAEYKIADAFDQLAKDIRTEVVKGESGS